MEKRTFSFRRNQGFEPEQSVGIPDECKSVKLSEEFERLYFSH